MELQIPEAFDRILKTDATLHGAVMLSFAEFEPWLRLSGMPFFPEYTDHGPKHVTETIVTASAIIRDESWPVTTAADVAALVLSILLHDSAMHISDEGFTTLVVPGSTRPTVVGFDDKPWPILWLEFLGEASRFDARKLHSLFGDTEPTHNPGLEPKKWTTRDRLLIGEFIRRHHARLGHEIALWGVPAPTDNPLHLKEVPGDVADIIGVIARSHGQSIRSCLKYLERYDIREYKGIHTVFLMTLVRVSDYLQIHCDRAPEQILRIRRLASPVSQGEWKAHDAVRDIRHTHQDPEAIFVDALPKDVRTYLKLKRLLAGIQSEMDGSWAALGEVYGRYDGLKQLGLKLRRVRSNLDAEETFAKLVPYIPREAKFEAADADLLTLLIRPLYGDRPGIGIRELVQNAVDACRELKDYLRQRPSLPPPELTEQDADVVVTLEQGTEKDTGWLEISDTGIGMTADVVRNYFLKAGASFRRSDSWRQMHEDSPGKSRVLRSGRFGIGVLASFLLGSEVEVSTRYVDSPPEDGISFAATIDSDEIELTRTRRPVGTKVRIRISEKSVWTALTQPTRDWETESIGGLSGWDWYCLSDPKVSRIFNLGGKPERQPQRFELPLPNSSLPDAWHSISHPDYLDIQWTYESSPQLVCNGIKVLESLEPYSYYFRRNKIADLWEGQSAALKCPNVAVFDPDGHLPLLLQRNGLATGRYPFHEELLEDVIKDTLAFILVNAPEGPITDPAHCGAFTKWYPGFDHSRAKWLPYFSLKGGTSFLDAWHVRAAKFNRALVTPMIDGLDSLKNPGLNPPSCIFGLALGLGIQDQRGWFRVAMSTWKDHAFAPVATLNRCGGRILLRNETYRELKQPGIIAKNYWSNIQEEFSINDHVLLRAGKCPDDCLDFRKLLEETEWEMDGLTECYFTADNPDETESSPIVKAWKDIIGRPAVPFEIDWRRRELKEAFEHLRSYITAHEKSKNKRKKPSEQLP